MRRRAAGCAWNRDRRSPPARAGVGEAAAQVGRKLDDLERQLESAAPNARDAIYARRYELTAELNLANTQRDVQEEYAMFVVSAESGDSAALGQKIDELERSVPELQMAGSRGPTTAPSAAPGGGVSSRIGRQSSGWSARCSVSRRE